MQNQNEMQNLGEQVDEMRKALMGVLPNGAQAEPVVQKPTRYDPNALALLAGLAAMPSLTTPRGRYHAKYHSPTKKDKEQPKKKRKMAKASRKANRGK